jgi:ribonuclease J
LRHILPDLDFPPLYTTPLPLGLIRKNLDDKSNKLLKYKMVDPDMNIVKLGAFTIEFYRLNHSIPEAM